MASYHQFIVHHTSMPDCVKARGLVDWIFWTQTDPTALRLASQCAMTPLTASVIIIIIIIM
jgi:hypothetical protein